MIQEKPITSDKQSASNATVIAGLGWLVHRRTLMHCCSCSTISAIIVSLFLMPGRILAFPVEGTNLELGKGSQDSVVSKQRYKDFRAIAPLPSLIAQSTETPLETPVEPSVETPQPEDSSEEEVDAYQSNLARQSQNPVSSLISVPFQNNTNFGVGQFDNTSNVLNIQPVIPTPISSDWNLINRTIIPLAYQPELAEIPQSDGSTESIGDVFGLGDIVYQGFFSPRNSGSFTWGAGPILSFPTATDEVLGTGQWAAGPAAVGLVTSGPIVTGALVSQLWSFAGDSDRSGVSLLTFQPFFNYNFDGGWYVTTSPIITANWKAASGNQWTIPIGGGFGRVFAIGRQPVNMSLQAYWNAEKPEGAADWTLRTQIVLLFP